MQKINLQRQMVMLIEQLSTEKLKVAVDYLMYLQDKDAWEATRELSNRPDVVASLKRAEDDVKSGWLKSWQDVRRDV